MREWRTAASIGALVACAACTAPHDSTPLVEPGLAAPAKPPSAPAFVYVPAPAGARYMELAFAKRGKNRPWLTFRVEDPASAIAADKRLLEEHSAGDRVGDAVDGTRETRSVSIGGLTGTMVSAELLDGFCRAHFAQAKDQGREAVLSFDLCSSDKIADAQVDARLAAFVLDRAQPPPAGYSIPESSLMAGIGPYAVAVPSGLHLTYAQAGSGTGENMRVKFNSTSCRERDALTWQATFEEYRESHWTVTTRDSKRGAHTISWAVLDESSSASKSKRLIQLACIELEQKLSLRVEHESTADGISTVTFETLVAAAIALALPP